MFSIILGETSVFILAEGCKKVTIFFLDIPVNVICMNRQDTNHSSWLNVRIKNTIQKRKKR